MAQSIIELTLPENAPVGTYVTIVTATDADEVRGIILHVVCKRYNLTLSSFCEIKYVEIKFFVRQIFYLQLRNVFILGRLCRVQMRSLCTALTTTWMRLRLMASPG